MNWLAANDRTSPSMWMRVLAALCLCLLLLTSSVQATHLHGHAPLLASGQASASAPAPGSSDADASCAFCAGFHSALHLAPSASVIAALLVSEPVVTQTCRGTDTIQHFALFTRPPPVLL